MSETKDIFKFSDRITNLPPYLFAKLDKIKQEEIRKGRKLISLGMGDPDQPTPEFIIESMKKALENPKNHSYPSYPGKIEFRKTVAKWYQNRFGVGLNAESEVLTLIGSKEGIAHLPLAFLNPGEATLVPDPAYPVYDSGTLFAGGVPLHFSLRKENSFLPDFSELERLVKIGPRVRILFLNYPNNPTGATATIEVFKETVKFAKKHDLIVCHDNAYSEIYFDQKKQPSFLEVPGAKEIGCEFHSLSKTFNMTGWRVGFVVGHPRIIEGLGQVKTRIDSGVFNAVQEAGITALENSEPFCTKMRSLYQERRDVLVPALRKLNLKCQNPEASFYVWAELPEKTKSEEFCLNMIYNHGVICTPGVGFGDQGEGFVRFTLCSDVSVLKQVAEILKASI